MALTTEEIVKALDYGLSGMEAKYAQEVLSARSKVAQLERSLARPKVAAAARLADLEELEARHVAERAALLAEQAQDETDRSQEDGVLVLHRPGAGTGANVGGSASAGED